MNISNISGHERNNKVCDKNSATLLDFSATLSLPSTALKTYMPPQITLYQTDACCLQSGSDPTLPIDDEKYIDDEEEIA